MGWIKDSSGLKIFESDELKHNYLVDDEWWEDLLITLSVIPEGGRTRDGRLWDGGKKIKFPPFGFEEAFEKLVRQGEVDDVVKEIPQ